MEKKDEKKVVSPLRFVTYQAVGEGLFGAKQPLQFAKLTSDGRLVGHKIPMGVDADEYLSRVSTLLDELEQRAEIPQATGVIGTPIVRSKNREAVSEGALANFEVEPVLRICFCGRDGKDAKDRERILARVKVNGQDRGEIEISLSDIDRLVDVVHKHFADAVYDFSEGNAKKVIETEFRTKTSRIPIRTVLYQAGWQRVNGKMRYVFDDMPQLQGVSLKTGLTLHIDPRFQNEEIGKIFLAAMNIYEKSRASHCLLLLSLMGVLHKLFRETGYSPRFLLFMNGRTGSMKTSLAKILFTQLAVEQYRDRPRNINSDTVVSLERAVVSTGFDTVILVDDFAPAKSRQKKSEMEGKLESLVRMVGDGTSKSRSNASLEDVQGEGVNGMIAVTGEIRGKGISSNLRCFYVEIQRKSVNLEILTVFQENPRAFPTAIWHFTEFLSAEWEALRRKITDDFPKERKLLENQISERRLLDTAATLRICADIFGEFLRCYCGCNEQMVQQLVARMRTSVTEQAIANEKMILGEDYSGLFLRGINSLMLANKIVLCQGKVMQDKVKTYDGFEDDVAFYFLPEPVYVKTTTLLNQMGDFFPFEMRELTELLYDDGIINKTSNGNGKSVYYARVSLGGGVKQSFLRIKKDIFQSVVAGTYEDRRREKG